MSTSRWTPRTTVAAIVERDQRFLIVEEYIYGKLVLGQPAGHLEPAESIISALEREVREETGTIVAAQALVGIYRWVDPTYGNTQIRHVFVAEHLSDIENAQLDPAIQAVHWMRRDELASSGRTRNPLVLRNIDDYIAGQRFPLAVLQDVL